MHKCKIKGHNSRNCFKCTTCNLWGHRDNRLRWCRKREEKNDNLDDENLFTDQLATMEHEAKNAPIGHHIFQGKWINRPSKRHSVVLARLKPLPKEHAQLGHQVPERDLKKTIPMIADSGCQSSVIPYDNGLQ